MPNILDNMDIITEDGQSVNVLFQDRGTLAIAQQNAASISALGLRIDGVDQRIDGVDQRIDGVDTRIDNINEGIYNNTTPTSGLTTNIGLEAGTYNIASDLTISAQLVVPKGAILNISSGVTLTINSELLAGRYQIFTGSGSVVIKGLAYPEWFGAACDGTTNDQAAIQKAINSSNGVSLDFGVYAIGSALTITGNKIIQGQKGLNLHYATENPSYDGTVLKPTHSSGNAITLSGVGNVVSDLIIDAGTVKKSLVGVNCSDCIRFHLKNMFIRNCGTGIYVTKNITSYIDNVSGYCDYDGNDYVFGFNLIGQSFSGYTGMASLTITNCAWGFNPSATNSIGLNIEDSINDLFVDGLEVAVPAVGVNIAITDATITASTDVWFNRCILDGCKMYGFNINNTSESFWNNINIIDSWVSCTGATGTCINSLNSFGIIIDSCSLFTNQYGIVFTDTYFAKVTNLRVTSGTFVAGSGAIVGTNVGASTFDVICRAIDYAISLTTADKCDIKAQGYECTANAHGIVINGLSAPLSATADDDLSTSIVRGPYGITA